MTKQTEKTEVIKIRLGSKTKTDLQKIASQNERTMAGQIRLALQEWIETKQEGRNKRKCPVTSHNTDMDSMPEKRH